MIIAKVIKIASNTKYYGLKNIFTHKSSIKNSLCGDKIKVELVATKNKINSMRYETEACILCEASASLIARKIKNSSIKKFKKDITILKKIIKTRKPYLPLKYKEFRHLISKDNANRRNCVILPIDALIKALKI